METDDVVRLRRAVVRLARQLNTSATDEGLTPTQASVLGLIVGRGPVSPSELAQAEHLNPTMLSRVIGRLEELELISRSPGSEDARSFALSVTRAGKRVHERIKAQRSAVLADGVEALPAPSQAVLERALPVLEQLVAELS